MTFNSGNLRKGSKEGKPEILYYDAIIKNPGTGSIPAKFRETLQFPLVENLEDYYIYVAEFNADLSATPLFIFKDNGADPSDFTPGVYTSDYIVTMTSGVGGTFQTQSEFLRYTFNVSPTPIIGSFLDQRRIFAYEHFLTILNTAINRCLVNLMAQAGNVM